MLPESRSGSHTGSLHEDDMFMRLATLNLVRVRGLRAVLGFQPSLQPQCPQLSVPTGPQTHSLISKSRLQLCVPVGEQKAMHECW